MKFKDGELIQQAALTYYLWQIAPDHWAAQLCGEEWHGPTRKSVESEARQRIQELMDDDEFWE